MSSKLSTAPPLESPPDPAAALTALAWARETADTGRAPGPAPTARPEDYLAAPATEVRAQLDALLVGKHPEEALDALLACGALGTLLPEVHALVGFGDGEWRHKDVWKHTKQVVRQAVPRLVVRWSALLHDIGKVRTRSVDDRGRIHFFGHSEVGAAMFRRRVLRRVAFDDAMRERIDWLILHHLRPGQYDASWTDSAVRRFGKDFEDGLEDLLALSRADITTKRPEKRKRGLQQISDLAGRIDEIRAHDAVVPPLPSGIGDVIMHRFGIPPSRVIGEIKRRLEQMIELGALEAHRDADYYVSLLEEQHDAFELPDIRRGEPDEAATRRRAADRRVSTEEVPATPTAPRLELEEPGEEPDEPEESPEDEARARREGDCC